jgi:Flp pilus assembly pilin Flp
MSCIQHQIFRIVTAVREKAATEDGQALIEYALILGVIAILTIGVLQAVGGSVSGLLNKIGTGMSSVTNP